MKHIWADEGGVSPVVAVLLLLSIFIGVYAIYMTVTIPSEFAAKEKGHMSEVQDSFLKLQTDVQEMSAGESRSIPVGMSANLTSGVFRGPSIGGRLAAVETTIISKNTVALWLMDEGSGSTVHDETANNNDGTLNGGVDWTTGRYNGGLRFENTGTPEYVDVPYNGSLNFVSGDYTIECWVNPAASYPAANGGWRVFVRQDASDGGEWTAPWMIGYNEWDDKVEFAVRNDAGNEQKAEPSSTTTLNAGTWYHIAGVKEENNLKLYIDGVLVATGARSGGYPTPENIYIGGWHTVTANTDAFNGVVDEVRIENRALSDSEIAEHAKRGSLYFEVQNAYYSPQIYVYEHGAVILVQPSENRSLMVSPPTMISVTPYGSGDNVKVSFQTTQLMGSDEVTSTGTQTLTASVENTWQTPVPSEPNMENVTITIHSDYRDAWKDYLVSLVEQLGNEGIYASADLQNLQLTVYGKETASGENDIYFVREFKDVSVAIS